MSIATAAKATSSVTSNTLALQGGSPVRTAAFPTWPIFGTEEEDAVVRVVRSGKWGRLDGHEVETFEHAFAAYHDCQHGIAVVNGSVSMRLTLLSLGIEAGDEVIVPPYTFLATASVVVEVNAVPVFADIHPDTLGLDPKRVEAAITPRTKAIIVVHLGGQAADMDGILEVAKRHNLAVIEDAAHAHGGAYKGRKLGSIGDAGSFSFQSTKNLNSGEGGIITTNNDALARLCRSYHNCGRIEGGAWYGHELPGGNYRLSEFQGAILNAQLARMEEQVQRRDTNGRYLNGRLSQIPGIRPQPRGLGETIHPYHLYCFQFDSEAWGGVSRETFIAAVRAEGIPLSTGYVVPLYRQPVFANRNFGPYTGTRDGYRFTVDEQAAACPVTERVCNETGCWLTQTTLLGTQADMDDIVTAIAKVYDARAEIRDWPK